MSKLSKEEKKEYEEFCRFTDSLTNDEINEIADLSEDYEVITPDSILESYFRNIPEVVVVLYLTISPILEYINSPSYVANLTYNPKDHTFEHLIIKPSNKEWNDTRTKYWENYEFVLPIGQVVKIHSQKRGKGKKKSRYYAVSSDTTNGIKAISKRKAHKMAIVRADIDRILSH